MGERILIAAIILLVAGFIGSYGVGYEAGYNAAAKEARWQAEWVNGQLRQVGVCGWAAAVARDIHCAHRVE